MTPRAPNPYRPMIEWRPMPRPTLSFGEHTPGVGALDWRARPTAVPSAAPEPSARPPEPRSFAEAEPVEVAEIAEIAEAPAAAPIGSSLTRPARRSLLWGGAAAGAVAVAGLFWIGAQRADQPSPTAPATVSQPVPAPAAAPREPVLSASGSTAAGSDALPGPAPESRPATGDRLPTPEPRPPVARQPARAPASERPAPQAAAETQAQPPQPILIPSAPPVETPAPPPIPTVSAPASQAPSDPDAPVTTRPAEITPADQG
ncbi:hypothetical protein Q0812_01025 [Brevundimonas sp. 2R-24]|uniref:Uncharacterized protein n=1 Tax=Peiella sedimenti TaxID=3061083 RepID=A0ABT8SK45_9CAUL|nr:hypothetical protein [Caulobacteraceae bacterium XZ-24]